MPLHGGTVLVALTLRCIAANKLVQPASWNTYWNNEAFLVIRNVQLKRCVEECQVRDRCKAVNYWRLRRNCELMDNDVTTSLDTGAGHSCLAIAKKDMTQTSDCECCSHVCDANSGRTSCLVKECLPLIEDNGLFLGNMISVGVTRKLVCNKWYKPEPDVDTVKCQDDGKWGPNVSCTVDKEWQYGGSWYSISSEALTFNEAQDYCRVHGANLVHVNDARENDFIKSMLITKDGVHSFWLGLTDKAVEGEWRWLDNNDPVTFSDWFPGEPNDFKTGEDCGAFWVQKGLKWNDMPCTRTGVKAICEENK